MLKSNGVSFYLVKQQRLKERIIIVGGGLSGLTLAYLLSKNNIHAKIVEASSRIGGRIQTIKGKHDTPLELGATWFSDLHQHFLALIDELGLQKYKQFTEGISLFQTNSFEPPQQFFVPENESPSYRLAGGTQKLIDTLVAQLDRQNISLNTKVTSISEVDNELELRTSDGESLSADKVILCLPPQLIGSQIQFSPELPKELSAVLPTVQTWMSGSLKFVVEYEQAFWRKNGYSGLLFSHSGIISEMYDHTNIEENKFGFTGFLNPTTDSYSQEQRKEFVLEHLKKLLGNEALSYISYFDKVWTDEFIVGDHQIIHRPHQNNGHPLLQQSYMKDKLLFAGTETATKFEGYMEGAVISANKVYERLHSLLKSN
ncbi:flavin monoamine oxidase family protein [Sediminitomix flava]|uniref:Monoamine oxidase n=1 Tax=Sediminitomix flava TaxID=379075 RepID=A0A315Z591_SEDFL|nr:FAD-dependent oxidoreductase [Sediminitomix flava]PWJ37922.1 monoamine oxidase [Sediminitomix flava]